MLIRGICLLFLSLGIFLLVQVAMPFLAFKFWEVTAYQKDSILVDPNPGGDITGFAVENIGDFPAIVSKNSYSTYAQYRQFYLTIPSLKLDWPKVIVNSNSFEDNLALLPGSALPGERGNVFITGHSSLTQLYKEGNYKAVFAHLPEIKRDDEIDLNVLGQQYKYKVEGIKIVDPKDISVVKPPDKVGRYLTLMTCVPPGFNTKRLIVLAKLY
ncbi:class E sortase [Candidatus Daviesbacteria bacterium]|nr:class E sortase [Candidatus Daviesbacteria bacterium]